MTLAETLQQKLAEWKPGEGRQLLSVPAESVGWSCALTADRFESMGCLAWEFSVQNAQTIPATPDALQNWAERIVRRVTCLGEPLAVLEVDTQRMEALVRTAEPTVSGDKVTYFELLLRGNRTATVRRFQASRASESRRQQTAFALTYESLGRLASQLTQEN